MNFSERLNFLRKNPDIAKAPLSNAAGVRDYTANCHGVSLYLKNRDNLLRGYGTMVLLKEGFPGFIDPLAMEGFLRYSEILKEIGNVNLLKRENLVIFKYDEKVSHSGIMTSEKNIFHLWEKPREFREEPLNGLLKEYDKRFYKII